MINTKKHLRSVFFEKRQSLEGSQVEKQTAGIASQLQTLFRGISVGILHVFLPIKGKNEIDSLEVVRLLKQANPNLILAVPRVVPGTHVMQHFFLDEETVLIANQWGIPEPAPEYSRIVEPATLDAVLIPLLAFDRHGYRVGYGGGFYDRFLAECRPDALKVGLSFFEPVDRIEDVDSYDVPMDYCVTPGRVWGW